MQELRLLLAFCFLYLFGSCRAAWFSFRMMRNPGLVADTAASDSDCVAKCQSTTGCSAISWNPSTLECLKSMCNNLDLFWCTGWNTFVMDDDTYLEADDTAPAPALEWMLTDTCGNTSQGLRDGPKMNLNKITYSTPHSVYAGKVATFSGSGADSYGLTDSSSAVNFPMNTESLTVMFWIRFTSAPTTAAILEFLPSLSARDMVYWYFKTGFLDESYYMKSSAGYPEISPLVAYTITPVVNTWYHVAHVYDGVSGIIHTFFKYDVVAVQRYRLINVLNNWKYIGLAKCIPCGNTYVIGSIYCVKVLNRTITPKQVAALGESCKSSKVRLSK